MGTFKGELGNQMFIIAATVSLALDHNAEPVFPELLTRRDANIPLNYQKVFYHLNTTTPSENISLCYREPHYHYAPIPYTPNMSLSGYFQSEKYFEHHKKEILELFKPHPEIQEYLLAKYGDLISHPNTVSVHFRSYLKEDPSQNMYPYFGRNYFEKAILSFPDDSLFVVFSNDMELCKRELAGISRNMRFIEGEAHYHDLYLMSLCKHNIISHSSYSWWAAYLNPNPDKKVITPPYWMSKNCGLDTKDVVPKSWISLSLE